MNLIKLQDEAFYSCMEDGCFTVAGFLLKFDDDMIQVRLCRKHFFQMKNKINNYTEISNDSPFCIRCNAWHLNNCPV